MTKKKVDDLFFQLFCEHNSDGTKHLRLLGKEIFQRYGFRLNQKNMHALAVFLSKHPEVISLDLAYNDIGDGGIDILVHHYFQDQNTLKHLNLLHCDIGSEGLKSLSSAGYMNLETLRLEGNKFGEEGAQFIGKIISRCENLKDLDIGETDQTNESIEALLILIEASSLKSLNISRIIPKTFYSKYNTSVVADNLSILLKINTSLEVLRVEKCEFDGHDMELLVAGLKYHHNLVMLDLGANRIGDHGLKFIAKWLITRPKLIGLRLPANNISKMGAQILGISLPFSRIRYLDLQNNRIAKKGILELLYSIKKSTQMRMFYIWGNEIGHYELTALETLLKAGTLKQDCIDIKIYMVDGVRKAAYYPMNKYAYRSYSIPDHPYPPPLKIIRNKIISPATKPRALINFDFVDRYPPTVQMNEKEKQSSSKCEKTSLESLNYALSYEDDVRLFV